MVTGGGAFNQLFIKKNQLFINMLKLLIPSNTMVEYKEALIFGFLGVLRLRGENNCLSSVTGAKKDHSSGIHFQDKITTNVFRVRERIFLYLCILS